MSEESLKASKVVPLQKPDLPIPRPIVPAPASELERAVEAALERRAEGFLEAALGKVLAKQNHLVQQNMEQHTEAHTKALRGITDELADLVESLREERDQLKGTAQKLVAQAQEVQLGIREVNAIVYDPDHDGETPQLANVKVGCQEISYPLFATDVANGLDISRSLVARVARACGIWENPEYHALLKASANTKNSRYKPRAIEKMRQFLENPAIFGVTDGHNDWMLVRHYRKRKGQADQGSFLT